MDVHHPHVGPATKRPLLNRVGRLGKRAPKGDRAAGRAARAAYIVAGGAQFVEGKAGSAAGLLNQGRILDRVEDLVDAVAHRKYEAGAEHPHLSPGVHQRRAVGHELAADHQRIKPLLPLAANLRIRAVEAFRLSNRPRHTSKQLFRGLRTPALLIFLQVPRFQDVQAIRGETQLRLAGVLNKNTRTFAADHDLIHERLRLHRPNSGVSKLRSRTPDRRTTPSVGGRTAMLRPDPAGVKEKPSL